MIRLNYNATLQRCDLVRNGGNIQTDQGLETAVLISWLTDRRAADDDELPGGPNDDRRGWWGDSFAKTPGDLVGSRRWLIERMTATEENGNTAADYMRECLQWMLDDGVASQIDVTLVAWTPALQLQVDIFRPDGTKWWRVWDAQLGLTGGAT